MAIQITELFDSVLICCVCRDSLQLDLGDCQVDPDLDALYENKLYLCCNMTCKAKFDITPEAYIDNYFPLKLDDYTLGEIKNALEND